MTVKILRGDCRDVLRTLADESVHCVVTSPPYFGLRDYGVAGQLGFEPTPDAYVAEMVAVFREVRRVLRKDGTLWLNLGDSYATGGGKQGESWRLRGLMTPPNRMPLPNLKPKDLCGIPWRVAFALQADGWWLRQDIIWSKPNPMPESIKDRCTKAHEYLFLFSKAERYYFDAEAIAEPVTESTIERLSQPNLEQQAGSWRVPGKTNGPMKAMGRASGNKTHKGVTAYEASDSEEHRTKAGLLKISEPAYPTRNKRSVWTVATEGFSEAHFATFPPALIEPCILAGTSEKGCCAKCEAPWGRERESRPNVVIDRPQKHDGTFYRANPGGGVGNDRRQTRDNGWRAQCSCDAPAVPCTVLDPFGGAGTTGLVADRLGRNAILIELNPDYAAMAERRIRGDAPLFAEVT